MMHSYTAIFSCKLARFQKTGCRGFPREYLFCSIIWGRQSRLWSGFRLKWRWFWKRPCHLFQLLGPYSLIVTSSFIFNYEVLSFLSLSNKTVIRWQMPHLSRFLGVFFVNIMITLTCVVFVYLCWDSDGDSSFPSLEFVSMLVQFTTSFSWILPSVSFVKHKENIGISQKRREYVMRVFPLQFSVLYSSWSWEAGKELWKQRRHPINGVTVHIR